MKGLYLNATFFTMLPYLYGIYTKFEKEIISIFAEHFDHSIFNGVSI